MERLAPDLRQPTRDELRRLAEIPPGDGQIVSLYVDLDPTLFSTPAARQSQVTSLVDEAKKRAENDEFEHHAREALKHDLDRIRAYCETALPTNGVGAVAIFCSTPQSLFEVMPLPRRVDAGVVIDTTPYIEPLAEYVSSERWAVALINRSSYRLFTGSVDDLEEVREIHDLVHGQHEGGGWSQARFQRSVERDVQIHLTHVGDDLKLTLQSAPFDHLLVGSLPELRPAIESAFHAYLLERIRGWIDVDVEHSTIDDVREAARAGIETYERERERALLDRLAQNIGRAALAAAGRTEVLRALDDRRVGTLLLKPGATGSERALHLALAQSADVLVVRHHDDLDAHDGMAALLRF